MINQKNTGVKLFRRSRNIVRAVSAFLLVSVLLSACSSASDIGQYQAYLASGQYDAAAEIYSDLSDSEEDLDELRRVLGEHVMVMQRNYQSGELSADDYSSQLNRMATYDLATDNEFVVAAADVLSSTRDAQSKISQAGQAAAQGSWIDAVSLMEEARPLSVATEENRELFHSIRVNLKQDTLSRVEALESRNSLEPAAELLEDTILYLPNDNDLAVGLERLRRRLVNEEKQSLIVNVENLRAQEAWQAALDAISAASEAVRNDNDVKALQSQIQNHYEETLIQALEVLEDSDQHQRALDQVRSDLLIFPDSLRLQWKASVYEAIIARQAEVSAER